VFGVEVEFVAAEEGGFGVVARGVHVERDS